MPSSDSPAHRYHDGTKHHYHRFARSLGYLDWASQPSPFRRFRGSRVVPLFPSPAALNASPEAHGRAGAPVSVLYDDLFTRAVVPSAVTCAALGDLLRHALGLSAWKSTGQARWSLRVNPSSGNLHPTEAYLVSSGLPGLSSQGGVFHYAAEDHALEERCAFDDAAMQSYLGGSPAVLVALTSIHWRESWKYGERAFRYCQHDLGHAIAAVSFAAAALGWRTTLLPRWSHSALAAVTGVDRDEDFVEAEREEPGCVLLVGPSVCPPDGPVPDALIDAVRAGHWTGAASQLSEDHVQWTFIDEIAEATRTAGTSPLSDGPEPRSTVRRPSMPTQEPQHASRRVDARSLFLQRRSAVAFDGKTVLSRDAFLRMLLRVSAAGALPFDALWWTPQVHLLLFVHRVATFDPGLYFLGRSPTAADRFCEVTTRDFGSERVVEEPPLVLLGRGDCRALARRLGCDQDIAADCCFSLAMLAEFDEPLARRGPAFYRQLHWECGVIGQLLYLEAEAAGVRSTAMGCFYDDGVHESVGVPLHAFQSLYHFAVGGAVEDRRIRAEPGYLWERRADALG